MRPHLQMQWLIYGVTDKCEDAGRGAHIRRLGFASRTDRTHVICARARFSSSFLVHQRICAACESPPFHPLKSGCWALRMSTFCPWCKLPWRDDGASPDRHADFLSFAILGWKSAGVCGLQGLWIAEWGFLGGNPRLLPSGGRTPLYVESKRRLDGRSKRGGL